MVRSVKDGDATKRLGVSEMAGKMKRKDDKTLSKCRQCLAYYSHNYDEATGGHECNPLILALIKMKAKGASDAA